MGLGLGLAIGAGLGFLGSLLSGSSRPRSTTNVIPKPKEYTDIAEDALEKYQDFLKQYGSDVDYYGTLMDTFKQKIQQGFDNAIADIARQYVLSEAQKGIPEIDLSFLGIPMKVPAMKLALKKAQLARALFDLERASDKADLEELARNLAYAKAIPETFSYVRDILSSALPLAKEAYYPLRVESVWTPSVGQLVGEGLMRTGSLIGSILLAKALL